jgi:hypothetical protein
MAASPASRTSFLHCTQLTMLAGVLEHVDLGAFGRGRGHWTPVLISPLAAHLKPLTFAHLPGKVAPLLFYGPAYLSQHWVR